MNPSWVAVIIDVEGVFLKGKFENGVELYIDIYDEFQAWYPGKVVLIMNIPWYETKQAT